MFSLSWGYFVEVSNFPIFKRKHSLDKCFEVGLYILTRDQHSIHPPLPTLTSKASVDHAGDDGQDGRFHTCLCGDSKTVQIIPRTLFSRMKLTGTSQLSVLSLTNRKDSPLILLLPSRKEKKSSSKPCWHHHLPICPEPSNDEAGAWEWWELSLFYELQKVGWGTQREA